MSSGNDQIPHSHPVEPTKEAWLARAKTLSSECRFAEAFAACEQALRLAPDNIDAYIEKGFSLSFFWSGPQEKPGEAREAFEHALALCERAVLRDPHNPHVWSQQGDVLCWLRREEEALGAYEEVVRLAPQDPWSYCEKADALFWFQRDEEGRTVYEEALHLDPENTETYRRFARSLHRNLHRDALTVCGQAIALNPREAETHALKSSILWEMMRYKEALEAIEEAIRLDPDTPSYPASRAMVLCYLPDKEKRKSQEETR